jgi:hypothetical protein
MRKILASVAATLCAAFAIGTANAATVSFSNITGTWFDINAVEGDGVTPATLTPTGNGTNVATLPWGDPPPGGGPQSSYAFDGASNFMVDVPPTAQAILGTFTHNNNPIADPGEELLSTSLRVTLDIIIDAMNLGSFSFDFDFDHNETTNTGMGCCNDIVTITNLSELSQDFLVNGVVYTISILGFQIGGDEFSTVEGQANTANLLVQVSAIPLPGALTLFAAGLVGLGFARRRRRAI